MSVAKPVDTIQPTIATTGEYQTSWEQFQAGEWPYDVKPLNPDEHDDAIILKGRKEYAFKADDGEIYQGVACRQMVENGANNEQPIWLGFDVHNRETAIEFNELFRGTFVGGQPGMGKTTTASNFVIQLGIQGKGCVFVDPGGEEFYKILRRMPDEIMERVVVMNPTKNYRSRTVGINYLDTAFKPDEAGFDEEVENIVSDILPLLDAEYPLMKGVAENMLRAMIRRNNDPDHEYKYCLIDVLFALATDETREAYYQFVDEGQLHFLKPYADKIMNGLEDTDLEPLLRRIKNWVENALVRPMVAQRESDISIARAIEEDLIIIVNADTGDAKARRMISTALTRKVWSVVFSRLSAIEQDLMRMEGHAPPSVGEIPEGEDFKPYFVLTDEFHAIVDENMNVDEMLAMARKKRLGIVALTQQLQQLPKDDRKALLANAGTKIAFRPGDDQDESRALAKGFPGKSPEDLLMPKFHATMAYTDPSGGTSPPFESHMMPLYPPRRSREKMNEWINWSLERFGNKVLTDEELLEQVPGQFTSGIITVDQVVNTGDSSISPAVRHAIMATTYCMARRTRAEEGYVPTNEVIEQIKTEVEETVNEYEINNWIEKLVGSNYMQYANIDGVPSVRVEDKGLEEITDSGKQGPSGKEEHRRMISQTLDGLIGPEVGYSMEIPKQDGTELPDLVGKPPVPVGGHTSDEAEANKQRLIEEHPRIYALSGESPLSVEIEKGTLDNPHQVGKNLAKALRKTPAHHVLFVVEQGDSSFTKYAKSLHRKFDEGQFTHLRPPADVDRKFWTGDGHKINDQKGDLTALWPDADASIEWVEIEGDIIVRNRDTDSNEITEIGRYASYEEALSPLRDEFPAVARKSEDGWAVQYEGDIKTYSSRSAMIQDFKIINRPFFPEYEFGGELPSPSSWSIGIAPNRPDIPLQIYDPETDECVAIKKLEMGETTSDPTDGLADRGSTEEKSGRLPTKERFEKLSKQRDS